MDAIMFVRTCLRARWDATALNAVRIAAAQPDFDGAAVAAAAQAQGLAPLVYSVVRGQGWLSAAAEQPLRMAYYQNARRNVLLFRELGVVLQHLSAAGIPVIVLKGAALAHTVYDNPAVRPMCDVDLLVREADVPAALHCCEAQGYTSCGAEPHAGDTLAYENEIMLRKSGSVDAVLELHWSLFDSPYYQKALAMDWFWQTALPATIEGVSVHILGPEAQVLHLCGHLALHHGQGAILNPLWLYDIAAYVMVTAPSLDWDLLLLRAQEYNLLLSLRQVLEQVISLWRIVLPVGWWNTLQTELPSEQETRVFKWLTADQRPVLQRFWADLASIPDWRGRLVYAWHSVFPSGHYMRTRYHIPYAILLPLYYPYRWWLGLWELRSVRSRD